MKKVLSKFGPGFVFAGAAIGVSHLVQSTRAGADFGFGLLWALLLINAIKYPTFEFGPRYSVATGESLLEGYKKMGKGVLIAYFILTFATMFTIQTAVTIVTAGIASSLFGGVDTRIWTAIITGICFLILMLGRYKVLDTLMKVIVLSLTLSTVIAVIFASKLDASVSFQQILPTDAVSVAFLIAFMGWMPAPLDLSVWQSLWTVEKQKLQKDFSKKQSRVDFNTGYIATTLLAIGFLALGALVLFGGTETLSTNGKEFSKQFISMYTTSLGESAKWIIGIAALTAMFSTTLTTLDGSPRVMHTASELLQKKKLKHGYLFWLIALVLGTLFIFLFLISEMGVLVHVATVLSFLTAPFFAILNHKLIFGKHTPSIERPSKFMKIYSGFSIVVLVVFSIWYVSIL